VLCLGAPLDQILHALHGALPDHVPAGNAAGGAVYLRDKVDLVFLCVTKVNSSSSSAVSTLSGCGG